MRKRRITRLTFMVLCGPWLVTACGGDAQLLAPTPQVAPSGGPRHDVALSTDASGAEYEPDTGDLACPKVLRSNVRYYVNINAVGSTPFTFYAPHFRIAYLGKGVYRYGMTIGKSDDNVWMAEGPWTGTCIGVGGWGIGRVLSFEGTIWRVDGGGADGDGCGDSDNELYEAGYTPYEDGSTTPSTCGGGTGGSGDSGEDMGSGTQFYPGDYTGGETVDWETGKGNGGTSVCGDKAVVEYVCIDVYNEETGQWEVWSCGYATTC